MIAREPVGRDSVEPETNTLEMGWRVSGSAERRPTKNCRTCEKAAAIPPATPERAVTIVELLVVIMIILILAGLILSISSYVQNKGARARAETEIAAMSTALESYKADNGIYPRISATDSLDARTMKDPANANAAQYQSANLVLYRVLSGDRNLDRVVNAADETLEIDGSSLATPLTQPPKSYFGFTANQLAPKDQSQNVQYIRDPFGNAYGYSTAYQNSSGTGYNPTFDLWSTAGKAPSPTPTPPATQQDLWIKNW